MGELAEALAEGSYFQFAAASVWLICEAGEGAAQDGAPEDGAHEGASDGGAHDGAPEGGAHGCDAGIDDDGSPPLGAPAVRLTHFADMSMHREAGCNPAFLSALTAIHAALRLVEVGREGCGTQAADGASVSAEGEATVETSSGDEQFEMSGL